MGATDFLFLVCLALVYLLFLLLFVGLPLLLWSLLAGTVCQIVGCFIARGEDQSIARGRYRWALPVIQFLAVLGAYAAFYLFTADLAPVLLEVLAR